MSVVVVSQPYYFPWIGLFEQIRLCDIFVHYDDVQFIKRHFMDRVQIPVSEGFKWITVPKIKAPQRTRIDHMRIDYSGNWQQSQLDFLSQNYKRARYRDEMIEIVENLFQKKVEYLSELTIESIMSVVKYYKLDKYKTFLRSSDINIPGQGTDRLLKIVESLEGDSYLTGMGALKYFDYEMFTNKSIGVEFMQYRKTPYKQLTSGFNPFVSILDLIANHGKEGVEYISSGSIDWETYINSDEARNYLNE